ncbi:MAG: glycoside hydrolase family 9 protein [Proteobacteria bacterium]|nr:glycoside hydrolase family 9 protein [Pseudomonadota bacterium]
MLIQNEANAISITEPATRIFSLPRQILPLFFTLWFLLLSPIPASAATTIIGNNGLVGYWPLENHWQDIQGRNHLTPVADGGFAPSTYVSGPGAMGYGPTSRASGNGAVSRIATSLNRIPGATMEGWIFVPDNTTAGTLFGFGRSTYWNEPKFTLSAAWGFLEVNLGARGDGISIRYPRYGDHCWHHVALVMSPLNQTGVPIRFYVDGNEAVPQVISSNFNMKTLAKASLFGSPFRIGNFESTDNSVSGSAMRVDEVRLWNRALSPNEITLLSRANGSGVRCEGSLLPRNPVLPRRCQFPAQSPIPSIEMGVRIFDKRTIAIVADPNPWLKSRVNTDCGVFLQSLEDQRSLVQDWFYRYHYSYSVKETLLNYRPALLKALSGAEHYQIKSNEMLAQTAAQYSVWPQAVREFRFPAVINDGSELHTDSAEVVYFSYLSLPFDMQNERAYTLSDRWGHSMAFVYNDNDSLSWAVKTNQLGYRPDAGEKYAYLGAWLGPVLGALDFSSLNGRAFEVINNSNGSLAFTGKVAFRADDRKLEGSGELVYQMDFSTLNIPGNYYIRVPGVGRSRTFTLGNNALGEAFYIHARGMYHQRCGTNLTTPYTAWTRGDNHTGTWLGGFPPDDEDYRDHSAEAWGFKDENGQYPANFYGIFNVVKYTATETVIPGLKGGWHDAADFDRNPSHLNAVNDLIHAYLMFPENFTDGQLNLPESGNGVPDILDEAAWGMEVWRLAQQNDGRVSTRIEATSHPQIFDPAKDTQRYYLALATHNSSLTYAHSAALLGRALVKAGDTQRGLRFIDSARRAYDFGAGSSPRISVSFKTDKGLTHTWTEPPSVDPRRAFYASVQLWLATGDPAYRTVLNTAAMQANLNVEVGALFWRTNPYELTDITLSPSLFPTGWAASVNKGLVNNADYWLGQQMQNPYRKLWYAPGQGYFPLMAWGHNGFMPIKHLIAAWRASGESRFLNGALLAVDWMHGGNPQGRVNTTGLGQYNVVSPLHLPSDSDRITDPVPGITIYGYTSGLSYSARTQVYGLFDQPYPYYQFAGSAIAQLPPPWDDTGLTLDNIGNILYGYTPIWRRLVAMENSNVAQSEFTVAETIVPAASVTGPLMGKAWMPSASLLSRGPRTEKEFRDSLWYLP